MPKPKFIVKCPNCKNYMFDEMDIIYKNNIIENVYKCSKCNKKIHILSKKLL